MGISISKIFSHVKQYGTGLISSKDQRIALLKNCAFLCSGFYATGKVVDSIGKKYLHVNMKIPLGIMGSLIVVKLAHISPITTTFILLCITYATARQNSYTPEEFGAHMADPNYIFPPNPIVRGSLHVKDHNSLAPLEGGPECKEHICLIPLPLGLCVEGDLVFKDYSNPTPLPRGLHVKGSLQFFNCTGPVPLPEGLRVEGSLKFLDCTDPAPLPKGLHVEGNLDFMNCTGEICLPQDLHVKYALIFIHCKNLILPQNLRAANLELINCASLRTLPEKLHVESYLNVSGCANLASLSKELYVEGYLDLRGCPNLTSSWVTQLKPKLTGEKHVVYLNESKKHEYSQIKNPKIEFMFS